MAQDEGDRQLDQGDPRLIGQLGELFGGIELALVGGQGDVEPVGGPGRGGRAGLPGSGTVAARQPARRR